MTEAEKERRFDLWWAHEGRFECPHSSDPKVSHPEHRAGWRRAARIGFMAALENLEAK